MIYLAKRDLEKGLFILKPDAVRQNEIYYARKRIVEEGMRITKESSVQFDYDLVWEFYPDKRDALLPKVAEYLSNGQSLALIVEGINCFDKLGRLKKEMRERFTHSEIYTGTHSSDSFEDAVREMQLLGI